MKKIRFLIIALVMVVGSNTGLAAEPYQSTYVPRQAEPVVIRNASVYDGTGAKLLQVDVAVRNGRIVGVGSALNTDGVTVIDAQGQWLTPGIIDVHSHLGVYPSPSIDSTSDGNEATAPSTAQVWAEHSVWPQDPQFGLALAGGVTSLQILPGSANLFGGRGVTLKNVPSRTVMGMKFPQAPHGLKMACGENPKRVYGNRKSAPSTRMGNVAGYRAEWIKAQEYKAKWDAYDPAGDKPAPGRDLKLETLVGVLNGEILVHNHCYRADEMATMIEIAKEFDYNITAFHHAVESYKIADLLAEQGICSAMWADWWGFKLEAFDGIKQNVALVDQAKACAIVHSDSARDIQHLNQEAAKAMTAGLRMGMQISASEAVRWITLNAAKALGVDQETGSIEVGKAADLVLWDRDPMSVYSRAQQVFIDGYRYYDRNDPSKRPVTDFALEQLVGDDR
ncbi:MAG: amidohydrolase family protein [Proteobacteria bacterium]|nr:amidohydrolase family protein [Pseudomonadota bacterium]